MRIDKVYIKEFKNLREFCIDLDKSNMNSVLLGQNAAGKSNFLEALVIIFRDLDLRQTTSFDYVIEYQCSGNLIKVEGGPNTKGGFKFNLGLGVSKGGENQVLYGGRPLAKKKVFDAKEQYLPKYVFSYYSGVSNRLVEHFDPHQRRFYKDLLNGVDDPMRPLFYARLIHSHFVLMAFYAFQQADINDFLKDYLDIQGLESILFVLKKPVWAKTKSQALDFWQAKGVVREFLNDLWDAAMAPITHQETVREDFRRSHEEEHLFLFISNQEKLERIAKKYGSNSEFFKRLESTYISDLIHEVRVKVKKINVHGDITFRELSEGEQQLLTVLGLLRFTNEKESLILLDEPDTHLNPLWKWKYMNLLEKVVQKSESSQIIMTTHDPLVIGGLTKEEIRVFYSEKVENENGDVEQRIKTLEPDFDPKGLGVAGILTSEFFNLPSIMDEDSYLNLSKKRELEVLRRDGKISKKQLKELEKLTQKLSKIGFDKVQRDPLYARFIDAVYKNPDLKRPPINLEDRNKQNELMAELIKEIMDEEKHK